MLEYTLEEAHALLTKNAEAAKANLRSFNEDLAFLRDQIVTTEVSIRPRAWLWVDGSKEGEAVAACWCTPAVPLDRPRPGPVGVPPRPQTLPASTTGTSSNGGSNVRARVKPPDDLLCTGPASGPRKKKVQQNSGSPERRPTRHGALGSEETRKRQGPYDGQQPGPSGRGACSGHPAIRGHLAIRGHVEIRGHLGWRSMRW